jgi:sporulation protein YlmC with PRC-barrel domain
MTLQTTFYLSRILGHIIKDDEGYNIGKLIDIIIEFSPKKNEDEPIRPKVIGIKVRTEDRNEISFSILKFEIQKVNKNLSVICALDIEIPDNEITNYFFLKENILNKQIVDLNGKKLVKVNDIRMVSIADSAYVIAVDVGVEGFLRKYKLAKPLSIFFKSFKINLPSKFILWDDVEAVDYSNYNIKLSKVYSKLHTLHPSDLADIIEDLGKTSGAVVFSSLDDEKAADVLEELQTKAQIQIIENLSIEKAADVLEKMPANEAADIIEELNEDRAEKLLNEMKSDASQDIRELLEYPDNTVGSLMSTEFLSFHKNASVDDVLKTLRKTKPDVESLYNIFITGANEKLIATVPLRDLLVSEPSTTLANIMNKNTIFLYDTDKIDSLAEMVSKYNLLAIPVTNFNKKLLGMVIIDDIVEDLVNDRRTNKK